MKVAVGALLFEGNTFSPVVAERRDFASKYLCEGTDIIAKLESSGTEMAGALSVARELAIMVVPLLATHGGSGGRVSTRCYRELKQSLLARLERAGDVDGVYLALHGSFIAEGLDDVEGELLAEVRRCVGVRPIVVSCDMHAHITPQMLECCDALIGYQHYPHDDTFQTGERSMRLLADIVEGRIKPHMRACRIPMLAPAQHQRTRGDGPMAGIFKLARSLESASMPAVSYFCVQPWLDFPDLGFTSVVVSDNADNAEAAAQKISTAMWDLRRDFLVETYAPVSAIELGLASTGYVVLADAADCVGGGASGDSAAVLAALLRRAPDAPAAIHIVDPEVASQAAKHVPGDGFAVSLGNKLDPAYGGPLDLKVELMSLSDGRFTYSGGLMEGVEARMGETAVLQTGAISILVSSLSAYEYGDEAFAANGIDVRRKKFVVVKNPMNYQKAYADAAAQYVLDTPGPTTPKLQSLPWSRLDRPTFPVDPDCHPRFALFPH